MKLICKTIIVIGLLYIHSSCLHAQTLPPSEEEVNNGHSINIEFNKNIEFLGYILYIGEPANESSQPSTHPLRLMLDGKRSKLKDEESLLKVFELGTELSYSLFVELFVRFDELPLSAESKIPDNIMHSHYLKTPDDSARVYEIMEHLIIFYQLSEFDQFWETSQAWYEKALMEINTIKPEDKWIETMEEFYEQKFVEYKIIPSLTLWSGPGFGFNEVGESGSTAYFVLDRSGMIFGSTYKTA
jgi:hypothetical protein